MVPLCEQLLINGVCQLDGCTASHDTHSCKVCRVYFTSEFELNRHFSDTRHLQRSRQSDRKAAGLSQPVRCTICPANLSNVTFYPQHARSRRHRWALYDQGISVDEDPGPEELEDVPDTKRCDVCDANIPLSAWSRHENGVRHAQAKSYVLLQTALEEAERDKNGVLVSGSDGSLRFGFIEWSRKGCVHETKLSVHNTNTTPILIMDVRITLHYKQRVSASYFDLPFYTTGQRIRLAPGVKADIVIEFCPRDVRGRFEDRVELHLEDPMLRQKFGITRTLSATVGVKEDYEVLRPVAPYVRLKRKPQEPMGEFIPGIPHPALTAIKWEVRLMQFPIPAGLLDLAFGHGSTPDIVARVRSAILPKPFEEETYGRYFRTMLWIEEEQARRDLQRYDMSEATLTPNGRFYSASDSRGKPWFEGNVHRVHEKSVDLLFYYSFNSFKGQKYEVRFNLHRLTLRRMHQGLSLALIRPGVLFPTPEHAVDLRAPKASQMSTLRCVDRKVGENPSQLLAVSAIVDRPPGSLPFIVYGPPGTGKTVTIIEAVRQILFADPNARILACAPSNSAADILAERLFTLGKTQVFRLIAPSRGIRGIPPAVMNLTLINTDGVFTVPPVAELRRFRVVVSTCFSAGILHGIGVPRGHITHIFIDECGQAQEPEVMIPIKAMADNWTNIVLSGDRLQLGPIVRSPVARALGLGISYLERMMARDVYAEDTGSGTTLVKLVKNWRSHPSILKFPNDEFYRSALEACGDPAVTHSLLRWDQLPTPHFPIIFHGVSGKDMREASSPSFFNPDEASIVKMYMQQLFEDRRIRLTPQNVGIISPYNAQVAKIRNILPSRFKDVKVGSVEEFQGQERRVIIISTVRSSMDFIKFDLRHTLGFVANPRRFNVAITRAQALLIAIGDPLVLSLDPLWKCFINYAHIGGGYTGKRIDWDPTDPVDRTAQYDEKRRRTGRADLDDLIERTRSLIIGKDLADLDEDEVLEWNCDKPWREDE